LIACFLNNISAKYYENPTMLSRVIAKNIGDVFLRHSVNAITPGATFVYSILVYCHRTTFSRRPIDFGVHWMKAVMNRVIDVTA